MLISSLSHWIEYFFCDSHEADCLKSIPMPHCWYKSPGTGSQTVEDRFGFACPQMPRKPDIRQALSTPHSFYELDEENRCVAMLTAHVHDLLYSYLPEAKGVMESLLGAYDKVHWRTRTSATAVKLLVNRTLR